ncbi:putative glycolipid-binding domain-containing protein [Kutzneria sp. NPDC052558]|uniref:putative glycolipid-binding domain-containing protein n=1 Tax=Kutzneria sp. NPDC052558 TaxID=3364121 RepID=UPI0037C779F4
MNVPNATEPAQSDSTPRAGRRPVMVTWQGLTGPRLESARLVLSENRIKGSGRVVAAAIEGREAYNASFELSVGEDGVVSRLLLRSTTAEEERTMSLSRTEDGLWIVDRGRGVERRDFEGALDVNLQSSVLFNALPVRRLGLHREAGEHELPVVWVSLPDLSVSLVHERYRTVSVDESGSVLEFDRGDASVELTVDANGLVVDYPGLARRV